LLTSCSSTFGLNCPMGLRRVVIARGVWLGCFKYRRSELIFWVTGYFIRSSELADRVLQDLFNQARPILPRPMGVGARKSRNKNLLL